MFRHRIPVAVSAALWSLAGFVADAGAITVNVTALPPPGGLTDCASVPNAVPNDTTDDYPAFKCAVAQIGASSPSLPGQERGTIYVPAGRYILTQTLVITNIHVSIRGEGQQISKLEWNHSGDGILFTSTHATMNYTLSVRSISLLAAAFGAAAIHAAWPAPGEHWSRGIITTLIHDVHIGTKPSESIPAPYWAYGIRLQNSTTAKIDMFNIQGASAVNGIAAIQLDALTATPNTRSISTLIRNGTILKYVRGIEGKIDNEGSHVQDVSMREVSWGIQMTDGLGTTLANNFIEARVTGIELINSSNFSITNNVINQFQTALPFIGILFTSTHATMNYTLSVRSISLLAAAFGAAAIHAAWPPPAEHWSRGIITTLIHDVHIGTAPSVSIPAPYWAYGIRLQNSTTAKIDMFNIQGASAVNGIAAIQLDALTATPNTRSISTLIRNGMIQKYVRGIEGKIDNEGTHVQDVSMREVSWGIQMTDGLGTTLANNFIEARVTGIELINSSNFSITNNVINQFQTALPFIGIHLDNVASSRVIGNSVWSPTGGASRSGILLKNATSHSVIEGNNTSAMEYGIKIDGTTAVWNVVEANLISSTPFPTTNGGVPGTNYFFNNHW